MANGFGFGPSMPEQLKLPIVKWIEDTAAAKLMKEVEAMWAERDRKDKERQYKTTHFSTRFIPSVSTRSQAGSVTTQQREVKAMPTGQAKAKVTGYTPGMAPPVDPAPPDGTYTLTMEKLGKPGKAGWKPGGSGWPSRMTFWVVDGITDEDGRVYVIPAWFTSSPDAITMFINAMISFGYTEPIEFKPLPERKNGDPRLDALIEKIDSVLSWVDDNKDAVHPRVTITTELKGGRSFSKIEWLPPEDYEPAAPTAAEVPAVDETEVPAEEAGEETPTEEIPVEEEQAPEPPPPPRRPAPAVVKVAPAKPGAARVAAPAKKPGAPAKPPARKK